MKVKGQGFQVVSVNIKEFISIYNILDQNVNWLIYCFIGKKRAAYIESPVSIKIY